MKIVCLFRQCRWRFLFNMPTGGVYQCTSCKTISLGSFR